MSDFISSFTLSELVAAFKSRELSPVAVTLAGLRRIEERNGTVNAIYHLDKKNALWAAQCSESRWKLGVPLGPLDGVPMSIKDALPTIGMPSFRGVEQKKPMIPDVDHPCVARAREAGAVIFGKNTMSDFGIIASGVSSKHGVTRNPWDLSRSTGASSSGAAASVAAGFEPATIGTDIVGSIRLPAAFCGLAGLKPSQSRVPYHFPNSPSLVAGPIAKNVRDLALMMNVLTLPDARDFTALPYENIDYTSSLSRADLSGKRFLVVDSLGFGAAPSACVSHALRKAAHAVEDFGGRVTGSVSDVFDDEELNQAELFYKIRCLTEYSAMDADMRGKTPIIEGWTCDGEAATGVELYTAFNALQSMREKAMQLIQGHDFLLLPTSPITAFAADRPSNNQDNIFEPWAYTFLFNLTEQPAASVPFGKDVDGLPIGIQIVGKRYDDVGVLESANILEKSAPVLGRPDFRNSTVTGENIFPKVS